MISHLEEVYMAEVVVGVDGLPQLTSWRGFWWWWWWLRGMMFDVPLHLLFWQAAAVELLYQVVASSSLSCF